MEGNLRTHELLLRVTEPRDIETLGRRVQALWLDRSGLVFDEHGSIVVLPIGPLLRSQFRPFLISRRRQFLCATHLLVISNVLRVVVRDEAQIGRYEIEHLAYDEDGRLQLYSKFPFQLTFAVAALEVELFRVVEVG